MYLARIKDVLEFAQDPGALPPPRFRINENKERYGVGGGSYLKRHGGLCRGRVGVIAL